MPIPDSSQELQSSGAMNATDDDRAAKLAAVRADLAALVADVTRVVEARASQAKDAAIYGAEAGVNVARDTIRLHPIPAITISAVVGAAIAVALTPASRQPRPARLADRTSDVIRGNLGEMAQGLQRSASSTGSSLLSAFERVVDSVSTIDPKSSLTPTIEKAAAWLSSLRETMSGKNK